MFCVFVADLVVLELYKHVVIFNSLFDFYGMVTGGICDYTRAAEHFLKRYRMGLLGRLTLDDSI